MTAFNRGPGGAATVEPAFINAKSEYGATGDGTTDDTTALQNAINAAIAAKLPLYLPPGEYKTSAELVAATRKFEMFGAGPQTSIIKPASGATYNGLRIGPGTEGSGNAPGGSLEDFGIAGGGGAEITETGASSTTGMAALRLDEWRLASMRNLYVSGEWDVGFDAVGNCFGVEWDNCCTEFFSCRVGMNIRSGPESGSDWTLKNCWLRGEVAGVQIGINGGGFHFFGGQISGSNGASAEQDLRGALIAGKEYTTEETGGVYNITLTGTDFEGVGWCSLVRTFSEVSITFTNVSFNANGTQALAFFKASNHLSSKIELQNCRFAGAVRRSLAEAWKYENVGGGYSHWEVNSSGSFAGNGVETSLYANIIANLGGVENRYGGANAYYWWHMGIQFEWEEAAGVDVVQYSSDGGNTWSPMLTPKGQEIVAAATIAPRLQTTVATISGNTNITKITATKSGHILVLHFTGTPTVTKGENLKLKENFVAANGYTLTICCVGANWYETARSAN